MPLNAPVVGRRSNGFTPVAEQEGKRLNRRNGRWRRLLRSRPLLAGLALVLGLIFWGMVVVLDLGLLLSPPPEATTSVSASTAVQTWAQARRTPENTGFTPDPGPLSPGKVMWSYPTSSPILTSPAVVGDRVYLTTTDGRALALDRHTGQEVWEYATSVPSDTSPAVAGDLVFLGLRDTRFIALDRETGALRWQKDLGNPVLASPIVVDGTVFIGSTNNELYALDAATGRERWTFSTQGWIVSPVAYADGVVAVTSQDGLLHIVDAGTGRQRFVYDAGWPIMGGPAIHGDRVYFVSKRGTVWSVDRNGRTYPFERAWRTISFNLYAWGLITSISVQKGTLWVKNIGGRPGFSPAIAHDTVYVANTEGEVIALDADTGEERWVTDLALDITSDLIVAGNTVLLGAGDGILYGLDASTGEELWTFEMGDQFSATPVVVGDTIYVASHDGKLYALSNGE